MKKVLWFLPVLALAANLAAAVDDGGTKAGTPGSGPKAGTPTKYVAPVMRNDAPDDTVLVLLPGPAPEPAKRPTPPVAPAAPAAAPTPTPVPAPAAAAPATATEDAETGPRPYFRYSEKGYPEELEKDTLKYLQERIAKATPDDIAEILGKSTRQRPAFGEDQKENGTIFAFADPTGKYKEFELDFDANTGMLRTVFAYPLKMTWTDCRREFTGKVTATDASKGRKFYSYADRRLDVLVGPDGKVVSLGLY